MKNLKNPIYISQPSNSEVFSGYLLCNLSNIVHKKGSQPLFRLNHFIQVLGCFVIMILFSGISTAQSTIEQDLSISVSGSPSDPSAALDISSDVKGVLIPRMSSTRREAISNPADGLLVYDSDHMAFYYFNGTIWTDIASIGSLIQDGDQDTRIETEFTSDDDKIRVFLNNEEYVRLDTNNFGDLMIHSLNPKNHSNIFIGNNTGKSNGFSAFLPTHGIKNTAIGDSSFLENRRGSENSAFGYQTLLKNRNGQFNTAMGSSALSSNQNGNFNTGIGYQSLLSNNGGTHNVAVGSRSMISNNTGTSNVAIGTSSLYYNTSGSRNVVIGMRAALYDTLSERNVLIGYDAGGGDGSSNRHAKSGNVFIGYQAGMKENNSDLLYIENSASETPLIKGDFEADSVTINGQLTVTEELIVGNSTNPNPVAGTMRWNSATSDFEGYNGSEWLSLTCCNSGGGTTPPTNAEACRVVGNSMTSPAQITLAPPTANTQFGYASAISGDAIAAAEEVVQYANYDLHFYERDSAAWALDTTMHYALGGYGAGSIKEVFMDHELAAVSLFEFDGSYYFDFIDLYQKQAGHWTKTDFIPSGFDDTRDILALSNNYLLQKIYNSFVDITFTDVKYIDPSGMFQNTTLTFPPTAEYNNYSINDLGRCQDAMVLAASQDTIGSFLKAGKVFVLNKVTDTSWTHGQTIYSPEIQSNQFFGNSISLSGDWLAIAVAGGTNQKVYLYKKNGANWDYFSFVQKAGTTPSWIKLVGHKLIVRSGNTNYLTYEYNGTNWVEIADDAFPADFSFSDEIDFDGWNISIGVGGEDVSGQADAGKVYVDGVE